MTRQAVKFAVVAAFVGLIGNGCGSLGESEDVGTIRVALQAAPADGLCLRLTVDHPSSGLKIVQKLALTPNQASQMQVGGLPTGSVGLLGEVFNVACGSITATTPLTWVSDRVGATITPDVISTMTLTLRRAGKINLGVDFVSLPNVEEIKLSLPPSRIAAAPDGTMVLTMVSSNAFWRLSTAFNLKQVATAPTSNPTQTRFITTAPDGSVLLSSNDNKQVLVYTGQGGLRGTLTLPAPMLVFDMVVDAMGIGWLGSSTTNQVIRVTNIQGLSPPAMQAITLPTPATNSWGLALAPDGTIGIAGTPSVFIRLSATGGVLQNLALPVAMQDLAFADDGTIWFLSKAISGNNVFKIPPGTGVAQPVLALAPAFTQVAIVNTPKGILFGTPGGGLTLMKADGSQQGVPLPGGAVVSSLAVNVGDGRVWATDSMASRLLVVTLP